MTMKVISFTRPTKRCVFLHACLFLTIVILCGCTANRYAAPMGTFRSQTQQTIGVLSDFYASRNSYEIAAYLQSAAANKDLEIGEKDNQGRPTPLGAPVFSPASIKARMDALNLIGIYASKLYDLANPDKTASFSTAATTLGNNISSLSDTFEKLGHTSDPTAKNYIGLVSGLVGTIGQMFLDRKRDELITEAIKTGA